MRLHFSFAAAVLVSSALAAIPQLARAQELSGTYVRYCDVGDTGSLVNAARSVAYGETAASSACDIFAQGGYIEGYAILGDRGATAISVNVDSDTSSDVAAALATVSGRTINWATTVSGLAITQEVSFAAADRAVRLRVTIRNTLGTAVTDLYYARHSDPDQAICTAGSDYNTNNDVVRQGPGAMGSLITATAAGVSVGLGSFDPRARASLLVSVASDWSAPTDPAGASADAEIALIFYVPTLAGGASTTFDMYYVFAATSATATTRFDALAAPPCVGTGTACSVGGAAGTCHSGACCTGCWDGLACLGGTAPAACGVRGGACSSCDDGNACTNDACSVGTCAVTPAPVGTACDDGDSCTTSDLCSASRCAGTLISCDDGLACTSDTCVPATGCASNIASGCVIDGACVASGTASPFNSCLGCVPTVSRDTWSPRAVGTSCGSPLCTGGTTLPAPSCDASGTCVDGTPVVCTTGRCNVTSDACEGDVPPDMGMVDVDGGMTTTDAGTGVDGGGMGIDGGLVIPPGGGRSRRSGCAVSEGGPDGSGGLALFALLGLATMFAARRRAR